MKRTQLVAAALVTACVLPLIAVDAADIDIERLRKAATFYASFDVSIQSDFGMGARVPSTRQDHPSKKGQYVVTEGIDSKVFQIAPNQGVAGGALECRDVIPRRGRIFFPAKGKIAYRKTGWSGTVSFWLNTDADTLLKTAYCDPVQITQKRAHDGAIWVDFPDKKPRDMRMGIFKGLAESEKSLKESDPQAAIVRLKKVGLRQGTWNHVAIAWKNFDTGKANAESRFYVDGKLIGEVTKREIAMNWDLEKTGIYFVVSYIGLFDEFALFNRALSADEIKHVAKHGDLLQLLKSTAPRSKHLSVLDGEEGRQERRRGERRNIRIPKFPFDAQTASQYQAAYARWRRIPVEVHNDMGMRFHLVPPGDFLMGSPEDEPARKNDERQHRVRLTRPYYLGTHEVTVEQFRRFVSETKYVTDGERNGGGHAHDAQAVWKHRPETQWRKPGYAGPFKLQDKMPVVHVSHADAKAFCAWLQGLSKNKHLRYDLPTEAEWVWACRAGSGSRFWWGDEVDKTGKRINAGDRTLKRVHPDWPRETMPMDDGFPFPAPVGTFSANPFGLHDMLGNVWEFCSTKSGPYPAKLATDPGDLDPKRGFAVRGGGWSNTPHDNRCATRNADPPHFCHSNLGFRVKITLPPLKVVD
jgi:formylglycine-generating enzyme required for sulfatase activity